MPDKLLLPPDRAGYNFEDFSSVVSVRLDGGPSRTRADMLGGDPTVSVQWTLSRANFDVLLAFYQTNTVYGSAPFYLDLYLENSELAEYECHFVPGSFRLQSQRAHTFVVGATLEVKPSTRDSVYESALIMLFEEYGSIETADGTIGTFTTLFDAMAYEAYPWSTVDAENSAIVIAEYGSLDTVSTTFNEFETFFANAEAQPRAYDPEYYENLAFILAEYGAVEVVDDTLQEFDNLFANMVDNYQTELAEDVGRLLEEYPNEAHLDATLGALEDLISDLVPTGAWDIDFAQNSAEIILGYGSATTASDVLDYLDFTVNVQLPSFTGKPSTFDQELIESQVMLLASYGSYEVLGETLAEFDNLFATMPIAERTIDVEYAHATAILLAEYGSVDTFDETLQALENLTNAGLVDNYDEELLAAIEPLLNVCCSIETLDETLQSLEDLVGALAYSDETDTAFAQNSAELILEYGSATTTSDVLDYMAFTVNEKLPSFEGKDLRASLWDMEYNENLIILTVEYGSEETLDLTLAEFDNLFSELPMPELAFDQSYYDNLAILTSEYASALALDETLTELEVLTGNL